MYSKRYYLRTQPLIWDMGMGLAQNLSSLCRFHCRIRNGMRWYLVLFARRNKAGANICDMRFPWCRLPQFYRPSLFKSYGSTKATLLKVTNIFVHGTVSARQNRMLRQQWNIHIWKTPSLHFQHSQSRKAVPTRSCGVWNLWINSVATVVRIFHLCFTWFSPLATCQLQIVKSSRH